MKSSTNEGDIEAKIPTILLDDFPRDYYYESFEQTGVLCAAGVGMTPGLTDLMARWGVDRCDRVSEINVSWASFRPIAISPGLVLTTFWEMDPAEKDRAYAKNVAIPMSIGAQLVLTVKAKVSSGYHPAYEIFEPIDFFNELEKRGILVHERVQAYRRITT